MSAVYCPTHGTELDGGPVRYRRPHGHTVQASDVTNTPGRLQL